MTTPDLLSACFAALADPTRRAILARLALGETSVMELAEPFEMSLPAVSKHLKVLERAGLITRERQAQWRPCRIEPEALKTVDDWLERYRRLWEARLDRLEDYLSDMQAKEKKRARKNNLKNDVAPEVEARSIITARIIDAPRERIFDAFTDHNHLKHWWGPNGFTLTTYSMEVRAGGVWRFTMHGPDRDYENQITYIEVVRPERLVYRHGGGEDVASVRFQTTVTFEDMGGGKTRLTMHALFGSAEERNRVEREYHAVEGAMQTFARLAAYIEAV